MRCKHSRLSRKEIMENLAKIQSLIGRAQGEYGNDRDPQRADKLHKTLKEAFDLTLNTRD